MAVPTKQYGLILPQKKGIAKTVALQKHSVFGDDSDDETSVGESLQREAVKKKTMRQTHLEMQKALEQDSTVYDYDAVYDDIQKQRVETSKKVLSGSDKRPKYIHQLMKAVEDRKKEQDRRDERKIQKEREAEGDKFADKDAYVTSAYKQKLLEQKEEAEREKREAALEAALDVKKQNDLSGFYRHLLNQTVGEEEIPDRSANKTQPSKASQDANTPSLGPSPAFHDKAPTSGSDSEEAGEQKPGFSKAGAGAAHSKRQYRQRSPSSDSGEEKDRDRDRQKKTNRDREKERDRDRNRGRERDDRHGGRRDERDRRDDRDRRDERDRRDDRDRRKDRERDRERDRDEERSRGRGEDKYGRRDRSPKERERDRNGERDRRRSSEEDKKKHREEEKEKPEVPETTEKTPKNDQKPPEDDDDAAGEKEKEEAANKFAKRCTDQTVTSARDRYLARQMARSASKSYIEKEED